MKRKPIYDLISGSRHRCSDDWGLLRSVLAKQRNQDMVKRRHRFIISVLSVVGFSGALAIAVRNYCIFVMNSPSMVPLLPGDSELLIVRKSSGLEALRPGALVLVDIPTPDVGLVKTVRRVAAVAGQPWPDEASVAPRSGSGPSVPEGKVVVLAYDGIDSRVFGALEISHVKGRVVGVLHNPCRRWFSPTSQ